jgi:hypothetical protein
MATTTPNYGWDVPTSTDYVADGAVAIETLGDDIDASLFSITGGKNVGEQFITSGTFTTASALNLSSVLTDTYKAYRFYVLWKGSTVTDTYFRGRQNTTDYSSSAYYAGGNYGSRLGSTGAFGTQNGGTAFLAGTHNAVNFSSLVATIYRPNATQFNIHNLGYDDANVWGYHNSGSVLGMTNFNGFSLFPATGTITGTYTLTGIKF